MNRFSSKQIITIIASTIIIVGIGFYMSRETAKKPNFDFVAAKQADITQQVSVPGQVQSAQDLKLAFQTGGQIAKVNVQAGDKVKQGQVLLELDQKNASVTLNNAKAAVAVAEANYQKLLNGATNANVDVAQTTLTNAQNNLDSVTKQQDTLVSNAYSTLLNSALAAIPGAGNTGSVNPSLTGTFTGQNQGEYDISLYSTGSGIMFKTSGLEQTTGLVSGNPQALGTLGLYIQFPSAPSTNNTWSVPIPNTTASGYTANYNAYQAALQAKQVAIDGAQAQVNSAQSALNLVKTPARPEDVAIAKAAVDSAEASLQSAQNTYDNGLLLAPLDGTVTNVNAKIGELDQVGSPIVSEISDGKFEVQCFLSEADLGKVKIGDPAEATLDAYGTGAIFNATVLSIDPSATDLNGVNSYKTTLVFTQDDDRIKDGMGANIIITDVKHSGVTVVPSGSVIIGNNNTFVLVNYQGKIKQQPVTTGIASLDGYTEITSGLTAGDLIINLGQ